jgi:Protein of unknown function (DUF2961)
VHDSAERVGNEWWRGARETNRRLELVGATSHGRRLLMAKDKLFPAEAISFGQRLRFTIQHGPVDDVSANYSSVAFWYGQPSYSIEVTDALNTIDTASRQRHQYSVSGDTMSPLSSSFPGEFNYIPVTLGLDTASTSISFQMAINPANNGVRLTRVSDQNLSYQTANVYIDGTLAGTWMEPWN